MWKRNLFYSELRLFTKYGPKKHPVVKLLQVLFGYMSAIFILDATSGFG